MTLLTITTTLAFAIAVVLSHALHRQTQLSEFYKAQWMFLHSALTNTLKGSISTEERAEMTRDDFLRFAEEMSEDAANTGAPAETKITGDQS